MYRVYYRFDLPRFWRWHFEHATHTLVLDLRLNLALLPCAGHGRCGAAYNDLFKAPFEPWSAKAPPGSDVAMADFLLEAGNASEWNSCKWEGLPQEKRRNRKQCRIQLLHTGNPQLT